MAATATSQVLRSSPEDAAAAWLDLVGAASEQFGRLADEVQHGTEEFLAARLPFMVPCQPRLSTVHRMGR